MDAEQRSALHGRLAGLSPSQLDEIAVKLGIPDGHMPSREKVSSDRALQVLQWAEQNPVRLAGLVAALEKATRSNPATRRSRTSLLLLLLLLVAGSVAYYLYLMRDGEVVQPEKLAPVSPEQVDPCPNGIEWHHPNRTGIVFKCVPGGNIKLARIDDLAVMRLDGPRDDIYVNSFYMSEGEVTYKQYERCTECSRPKCTDSNGERTDEKQDTGRLRWLEGNKDDLPITCISKADAEQYAKWAGGRLPTYAEATFAATSRGKFTYPWGNTPAPNCSLVVMEDKTEQNGCGLGRPWPPCSKPGGSTDQAICDLSGNVAEWLGQTTTTNGREIGARFGGSFNRLDIQPPWKAYDGYTLSRKNNDTGFRIVVPINAGVR